tara:strand:+ start:863 stop:1507 length:645 start_codon:yes stop_codon:yes gene_type:complete
MSPTEFSVKKPAVKKSESLWMMTFSDLSFILMCFFALLLSMSTMNVKKYDNIVEGMQVGKVKKTRNLSKIHMLIKREIKKRKLEKDVGVKLDSEGLAVEFKSGSLFTSGSARLSSRFAKVTKELMAIIAKAPPKYRLSVEGHTDDTGDSRLNWRLSSKRGISMITKFKQSGSRIKQMRVVSFADTQPKIPVEGLRGLELKKARAANRRVVVRLN